MRIHTEPVRPIEEVSKEGANAGAVKKPEEPTAEKWEEHMVTHVPFRSWCPFCVKGRATGIQHRHVKEKSSVPIFGFDYLMTSEVESMQMKNLVRSSWQSVR